MLKVKNTWIVACTVVLVITVTGGCATTTVVKDWRELPGDCPILVTTKTGEEVRIDRWQFAPDSTLLGTSRRGGFAIPKRAIREIASVDESGEKIGEVSFMIVGSVIAIVIVYSIVHALNGVAVL